MDAFFASVEERENPQFRGKPIVVGADPKNGTGRGVVSTANYEARKFGLRSAMPITKAWRLCPRCIFLPPNFSAYSEVSRSVFEIARSYAKQYEVVSVDELYLDLGHLKDMGEAQKIAERIKKEIVQKEKITASIGIGSNKLIAKIASDYQKPDGLTVVLYKDRQKFLDPMNVRKIPGIGPKSMAKLASRGIHIIRDLRNVPEDDLVLWFGKWGRGMYQFSRGEDGRPVKADRKIKSIGKEHTFQKDTREGKEIFLVFEELMKEVFGRVEESGVAFRTITVVCRYQGFETHTKAYTPKKAVNNFRIFKKEAMRLLLQFLVQSPKPIRLIGIRVSGF